jgi:hypothetical protein
VCTSTGVRNILLASLEDILETWRGRITSRLDIDLKFDRTTPAGLQMLDPSRSNDGHSIRSQEYPLSFLGRVRNVLLASLDNTIDTWRRRSTSRLIRTLILDMVTADDRSNKMHTPSGVKNIILASFEDAMETQRRRSTSNL